MDRNVWKYFLLLHLLQTPTINSSSEPDLTTELDLTTEPDLTTQPDLTTEPDLTHPDFYKVNTNNPTLQTVQGVYGKTSETDNGYPVYKKFDGNFFIYVKNDRKWHIKNLQMSLRSTKMAGLLPLEHMEWELRADGQSIDEASISLTQLVFNEKTEADKCEKLVLAISIPLTVTVVVLVVVIIIMGHRMWSGRTTKEGNQPATEDRPVPRRDLLYENDELYYNEL
eukprot:GFUD01031336.1.p1 GENE.GFUD01031336.1~~GFUD01031336.1.p1  ORF type:complete len:234 (+),score=53.89 GFUD01031336.1:30-704(+)